MFNRLFGKKDQSQKDRTAGDKIKKTENHPKPIEASAPKADIPSKPDFAGMAMNKSIEAILPFLKDQDYDSRGDAATALGEIGDPIVTETCLRF